MSLSGTLDTLSLSELLTVLAATKRSGELVVRGASGSEGRLWLLQGALVKADVPPASDMVGAVTALLAVETGEFAFTVDAAPLAGSESTPLEDVLPEAQSRHAEWLALDAAVPSLGSRFQLAAEPAAQTVSVSADHWPVLVALAREVDVRSAMEELGLSELQARRSVRALREAGLLEPAGGADPPTAPRATPPAGRTARAAEPEPTNLRGALPLEQAAIKPVVEPVIEAEHVPAGDDEPVNRNLLFRYLLGEHS